jgi:hypothetical protein
VNASKLDLVTIGKNIQQKFDDILKGEMIDTVIIENQISPIANRMKTIQGMIAQYFIMKNNEIRIDFVNASNKLKGVELGQPVLGQPVLGQPVLGQPVLGQNTTYKDRKKMSTEQTKNFLRERGWKEWETFFQENKKKDDLADCFLQALWYLQKPVS